MIEWREPLYLDEKMKNGRRAAEVREQVEEKKGKLFPAFGIFLAQNPANLLEIISLNEFLQPGYDSRMFYCVGLAGDRKGAELLVQAILADTLQDTGGVRVREYLNPKENR